MSFQFLDVREASDVIMAEGTNQLGHNIGGSRPICFRDACNANQVLSQRLLTALIIDTIAALVKQRFSQAKILNM